MHRGLKVIALHTLMAGTFVVAALAQESGVNAEIITVRPSATTGTKQGLPIFQGISGQNAGAKGISMNKVIIPPGGAAKAHMHKGYESVIYLLKGRVQTLYGEGLKKSVINEAGDFLYIPADLPHKPINLCNHRGGRGHRRPHRPRRAGERRARRRAGCGGDARGRHQTVNL